MIDDIGAVYARLRAAGLVLRVARNSLHVSPRNRVTPELRALIAQHRTEIIARLQRRSTDYTDRQRLAEMQAEEAAIALIERIRAAVRELPF